MTKRFTYWTREGKFETDNIEEVRQNIKEHKLHRLNGPALQETPTNNINSLSRKTWYINGKISRLGGVPLLNT